MSFTSLTGGDVAAGMIPATLGEVRDLAANSIIEIELTEAERLRIETELAAHGPLAGPVYRSAVNRLRENATSILPRRVLHLLLAMRDTPVPPAALVITNSPNDPWVPPTPLPGEESLAVSAVNENWIALLGLMLGEPYGMRPEGEEMINDLIPHLAHEHRLTGLGSGVWPAAGSVDTRLS